MTQKLPAVVYHLLSELTQQNELNLVLNAASEALNTGHIAAIVNAFFVNTKICVNGIPYLKVSGLSTILRTGNSGAERPLIYQGIPGIFSASEIVEIDGVEHISGPTLKGLIDARISLTTGRTKEYLMIAMKSYDRILNLSQVRDLKDRFLEDIRNNRSLLKTQRIAEYNITTCEFTGNPFSNRAEVEFAHIESVVTNPMLALDINNGVIILRQIHQELTRRGIHGYKGMYKYCRENSYSIDWAG